jgi:CubicO group peptidase (beta-lactamase class C family)
MLCRLCVGYLLFLSGFAVAAIDGSVKGSVIASEIDAILAKASSDGSGYAIIVEVDGVMVLNKGYGYADREKGIAFTTRTIAQIGSLTKQFSAAALLQLADTGRVDLHSPLTKYIPDTGPLNGKATLHQLLTHSSGLPEYCGDDFERVSRNEFIRNCLSLPLLFEPGSDVSYSNIGYGAIAAVIEIVTGQEFTAHLDAAVLRPSGLRSTGHLFPADSDAVFARGYLEGRDMGNIGEDIRALGDDWWNLKGNGGMQASTLDMYTWYRVLNGDGALGENVRAQLVIPHSEWIDGVAEGYGWYFRSDNGDRIRQMSHSGSDGVFFSYYWHRPDERVFMYFVGNSGEEPTKDVLRNILGLVRSRFDEWQEP